MIDLARKTLVGALLAWSTIATAGRATCASAFYSAPAAAGVGRHVVCGDLSPPQCAISQIAWLQPAEDPLDCLDSYDTAVSACGWDSDCRRVLRTRDFGAELTTSLVSQHVQLQI
jgi:hypothetical protein